jgi:eukaryotic-like serine/threonine-protein kinase
VDGSTARAGEVLADRYELRHRLGAGGAGAVWAARDLVLGRDVAVKLLHPEVGRDATVRARFLAEASAAARLTHPNTVVLYDLGSDGGHDLLVMELVDGAPLGAVLADGPLPAGVVAHIGVALAGALEAAHRTGVVHRDVKPANVLVTRSGEPKLADFGIAQALGEATSHLTAPGHVMGTARYLAPEQLRDGHVDHRADLYALGLVLHEALTGTPPFGSGTAVEVAMRRLGSVPPDVRDLVDGVPAELAEALRRATATDADDRFPDAAAFARAVRPVAVATGDSVLADRVARAATNGSTPADTPGRHEPTRQAARPAAPAPTTDTDRVRAVNHRADPAGGSGDATLDLDPDATRAWALPEVSGSASGGVHDRAEEPPAAEERPAADAPALRGGGGGSRRRLLVALVPLALLLVVGLAVGQVLGPDGQDPTTEAQEAGDDADGAGDPAPDDDADGADDPSPRAVEEARDHDPFGDGEEHREAVANAHDGDTSTTWQTQRYRGDPALGGLKPGVGLWFRLEPGDDVTEVTVTSATGGASFVLFHGAAPPASGDDPEQWGTPVAEVTDAAAEETVRFDDPVEADVWLLWLTELPADGGEFRAEIAEVRFEGS